MFRLALRMLFGDHGKYLMLVSGITFASLLMIQQAGVFCGLLSCCLFGLRRGLMRGRFGRGALRRFGLRLA